MTGVSRTDQQGDVDAVLTGLDIDVRAAPIVQTRDVILVTGPWLAGSTSLADALGQRLGGRTCVESIDLDEDEAPAAVVFVTPAATRLTESDCVLLDAAAAKTDLVIGVVSKIDVHPAWRDVLAANRAALAAHNPRYTDTVWVGVAAAPESGEPRLKELVEALEEGLARCDLSRRNALRVWETRLRRALRWHEEAAAGVGRQARVAALRQQRSETLQERRLARSGRNMASRGRVAEAKEQLTEFTRNRCASVRAELGQDATSMTRSRRPDFENYVSKRTKDVVAEVHGGVGVRFGDLAAESGLTQPPDEPPPAAPAVAVPPPAAGSWLAWLVPPLSPIFGLAVALAVSMVLSDVAPVFSAAALVGGAVVGLAVAALALRIRRVARDRAVLDRWVADVTGELRAVLEQYVATRVLNAESALTAEQAKHDKAESGNVGDRIAEIDSELRLLAVVAAQATASRDREIPVLQRALEAVRGELNGDRAGNAENETENENLNRSCE
jgi:hypothetical protein